MGIEVTSQINEQECGVCVIKSLHNYYFPSNYVEKEEVLNASNMQRDGLSILDFENLAIKYNLNCETYQISWDEFKQLKVSNYFVMLVSSNNGGNHYVIVKKNKKQLEIYDSASTNIKTLEIEELQSVFLGIIILVNKAKNNYKKQDFSSHKALLQINVKTIIISTLLYTIVFGFSVANASFWNWLIDLVISKKSISNLITVIFSFTLIYILNDLTSYIISLYTSSNLKNNLVILTAKVLTSLSNKSPKFLYKVDKSWIYKIDECVYHISDYCIIQINKFITNIIFVVVCTCIVGIINPWLLIFCSIYLLIELCFYFLSYSKQQDLFTRLLKNENRNTLNYKNLIDNLENEFWYSKKISQITKIKSNYSNVYKNFSDANLYKSNISLFKSLLKSIFEIMLFAIVSYLAIKNDNLSIGKISFIIAAMNLLKSASSDIFNFLLYRLEFLTYWQVYRDLTNVDNCTTNEQAIALTDISNISFIYKGNEINISSHQEVNLLPDSFVKLLKEVDEIKINNQAYKTNDIRLSKSLIVVDEFSICNKEELIQNHNSKPALFSKYIRYFGIDLNSTKINNYHNLVINLLNLLDETGKIIIFDSSFDSIKIDDLQIVKDLKNKIMKNNFVFITTKE